MKFDMQRSLALTISSIPQVKTKPLKLLYSQSYNRLGKHCLATKATKVTVNGRA